MKRFFLRFFGLIICSYLAATLYLVARQRSYIYRPGEIKTSTPADFGAAFQDIRIPNGKNGTLAAWWLPHDDKIARPSLVYCHGNSANLSLLSEVASIFHGFGWNPLLFDYTGYGKSSAAVSGFSEEQLLADAQAAYDWVKERTPEDRIIIWGHSLGSSVAARLASQNSPAGLILEGSFPSVLHMAQRRYPWALIFPFMIIDKFETDSYVGTRKFPLLVMHAENDRITPLEFGRQVFESAAPPKQWLMIPGIGHKDFPSVARNYQTYFSELASSWLPKAK